jgi:thiol-disulfide isomerase/thioredoxin
MNKLLMVLGFLFSFNSFALEVGSVAPCVELDQISSNASVANYCIRHPNEEGQIRAIEFFSVTCSACAKNLPKFSDLHKKFGDKVTFRLVSVDRSEQAIRDYIIKNDQLINFDVALDVKRDAKKVYDVIATPTLFILDKNDVVVYKHIGVLGEKDIAQLESIFSTK